VVRTRNCALVALVACLPVVVLSRVAEAQPAIPTITHPQDDWAGSQIAAHEDTGSGSRRQLQSGDITWAATTAGMDVSGHQGEVDWAGAVRSGGRFAYVKATEGTSYVNPNFNQQYQGSYTAGMVRGAYHFATPNTSTGAAQADYLLGHGGGWSADSRTLPPAVDLEYNPYGQDCYGMTAAALVAWVHSFVNAIHAHTGRFPTIYTSTSWWKLCMGNSTDFGADPLWIARYNSTLGALPASWRSYAIWQFADSGTLPGDQDRYDGTLNQLRAFAHG
jgi:GH25 family lysozyme M1 (1,4-beta-N-acetylmuramidase)